MQVLRSEIERALNEMTSYEDGSRFQCLAVVLAKTRWPDLIACERKWDLGSDAIARPSFSTDGIGKVLSCSLTASLKKIRVDVDAIRKHFTDLRQLIFATPKAVSHHKIQQWQQTVYSEYGLELAVIPREDIVTSLLIPNNASLLHHFFGLRSVLEPTVADLIESTLQAAGEMAASWSANIDMKHVIDHGAIRREEYDAQSKDTDTFEFHDIQAALAQSRRLVLEAPAGYGKTTTLLRLAHDSVETSGIKVLVNLPDWVRSGVDILTYIAGIPSFRSRSLDCNALAQVYGQQHFCFLLNGWNEVTEGSSIQAGQALAELERQFPRAGIMVTTRAHHIAPPLSGAVLLRLMPFTVDQRRTYLSLRLGNPADVESQLTKTETLDSLSKVPLFLSAIIRLVSAGLDIPTTKIGIIDALMVLVERAPEHSSHLRTPPLSDRARFYLTQLAVRMTAEGAAIVDDHDARSTITSAASRLLISNQIASLPEPVSVLNALCSHHILERLEYRTVAFRFAHQQVQEYFAALELMERLALLGANVDANKEFTTTYLNEPAWAESIRMVAEDIGGQLAAGMHDDAHKAGVALVTQTLGIDPVFAAELAQLCGATIWKDVRQLVGNRLRSWYAVDNQSHRRCALAGMIATGSTDFQDILVPLLSDDSEQQERLATYRAWSEFHLSSLGSPWQQTVGAWDEEARETFVSELLSKRLIPEVATFGLCDPSDAVRGAAISGISWVGSPAELAGLLQDLNAECFDEAVMLMPPHNIPPDLRPRALPVLKRLYDTSGDDVTRLQMLLGLRECGGISDIDVLKKELDSARIPRIEYADDGAISASLRVVQAFDPDWGNDWVLERVLTGALRHESWQAWITKVPNTLKDSLLESLHKDDLHGRIGRITAVLVRGADLNFAHNLFLKIMQVNALLARHPEVRQDHERRAKRQLEDVFSALPPAIAIAGMLTCLPGDNDAFTLGVASSLLSSVGRSNVNAISTIDACLRSQLREYIKRGVKTAIGDEDAFGKLKADVASVLALIGDPSDLGDLRELIDADIRRIRAGRAARTTGDGGKVADAARTRYDNWNVKSLVTLDSVGAEPILLELLTDPDYELSVADEIRRASATPNADMGAPRKVDYGSIWRARSIADTPTEQGRRYARAIRDHVVKLIEERRQAVNPAQYDNRLRRLAMPLASLDGRESVDLVLDILSLPNEWAGWEHIRVIETLAFKGVSLSTDRIFAIFDSILMRIRTSYAAQDDGVVKHFLCMCPFLDEPARGIEKIEQLVSQRQVARHDLGDIVEAVGQSRCDRAVPFLRGLLKDDEWAQYFGDTWIDAVATIDSSEARELLLSFLNQDATGLRAIREARQVHVLAGRIGNLAASDNATMRQVLDLCTCPLEKDRRLLLSEIVAQLNTEEAILAGLKLLDDTATPSVPNAVRKQVEATFLERRFVGNDRHRYSLAPQSANVIRAALFGIVSNDVRRKVSAFSLLGEIEEWRLDHGRPFGEPRHPAVESGLLWPPAKDHSPM